MSACACRLAAEKTLLACHAAGLAMTDFMRAERAVVLWLVPSNTILDQTADALRDRAMIIVAHWNWRAVRWKW